MLSLKEIEEILQKKRDHIKIQFGVESIGIFGSYVRGEQRPESDIDIIVEFKEQYRTFDNYMDLKFYLEEIFGVKVDLISMQALKPRLKSYILRETVYV